MAGYRKRIEGEHYRAIAGAWYTAGFSRSKRLPSLRQALKRPKSRKVTPDELERRAAQHDEIERLLNG